MGWGGGALRLVTRAIVLGEPYRSNIDLLSDEVVSPRGFEPLLPP